MIEEAKIFAANCADKTIFTVALNEVTMSDWEGILAIFQTDIERYYTQLDRFEDIKYFPGLLATFFYRIARHLYLTKREYLSRDFSSIGFSLTGLEIYYFAQIGKALKINHGIGTVIGARTRLGDNVLLHHNITLGDKGGGRPSIGNNVIIYPGAVIVGSVTIGDNTIIGANTFIDKSIGENQIIK